MSDDNKDDWKNSIPESLRDAPFIGKAASLEDARAKLAHAASHVGNSIRLPDKTATDEQITEYEGKLLERFPNLIRKGDEEETLAAYRPADGSYTFEETIDPETLASFQAEAKAAGLTQGQFNKLYKAQLEASAAASLAANQKLEEDHAYLQRVWGTAYADKKESLKNLVRNTEAPPSIVEMVEKDTMDAAGMEWLLKWADSVQEGGGDPDNRDNARPEHLTRAEAQAKMQDIQNDPDYWNAASPRQQTLRARMLELGRIVYPGE